MEKRNVLQLVLNEIKKDYNDPTILPCKFVILDFDTSLNNVKVTKEVALDGGKTLLNKPIVAKYHQVSQANADDDNFGSHEEFMSKDKHGNDVLVRDTVALGVFTSGGYLEEVNIDGQFKEVMVADGVLWYSKYKDACDLLVDWHERGIKINSSCEYLYKNYSFLDGVEHHHSPIIFESHAILASESRGSHDEVIPAYESATLLSLNELQEFNKLVAQAANQAAKEETTVQDNLENEVLETFVEQSNESVEDNSIEATESEVVETEDAQVEEEVEVVETVDWETIANELQTKLDAMTTKFNELEEKFNTASNTIVSLNSLVEELKPYQEQLMNAQREKSLEEKTKHFSAKFEAIGATEQFESDEVQSLIAQSIDDTEAGKEALLALNTMIVDLIQEKQENTSDEVQFLGLASYRKDLVKNEDSFESRYKIK